METQPKFELERIEGTEPCWGCLLVVQHAGPPADAVHDHVRRQLGDDVLQEGACVFGGMDVLKVKAPESRLGAILESLQSTRYGGEKSYTNLGGLVTPTGYARVARVLPLGAPEALLPRPAAPFTRKVYLDVSVRHVAGREIDVLNAKTILRRSLGGRLVGLHATLGNPPGVLAELLWGDDLRELDHLVSRMLPSLFTAERTTTYIAIRFDHEDGSEASWKSRLRAYFSEVPPGEDSARNTTAIARELGTTSSVIQRPLGELEKEGFITSRKSRGVRRWWKRE